MPENWAEDHRNVLYRNNVTSTMRQEPGLCYPLCGDSASYSGNKKSRIENRFGRLRMEEKTTRNGDTNNVDISSTTRWIKADPSANVAPLLDRDDMQVTEVDLSSPLVKETKEAAVTYHDDMFVRGYFGNGWTGEDGETAVAFKTANTVLHQTAGITKAKLLEMRELMNIRNVNMKREMPILFLFPQDETDLLSIEEYVNSDYHGARPLEMGEIKPWLGFRFLCINPSLEAFPTTYSLLTDGTTRNLPCFVPSGMHRGIWTEFWGKISERGDKQHSWQVFGEARSACVRTDEDKCFIMESR